MQKRLALFLVLIAAMLAGCGGGSDLPTSGGAAASAEASIDAVSTIIEIEEAMESLPGTPVRVLTATSTQGCPAEWPCERLIDRSIELQGNWLALSPEAVQVLVESGHTMPDEVPDVVVSEVLLALEDAMR